MLHLHGSNYVHISYYPKLLPAAIIFQLCRPHNNYFIQEAITISYIVTIFKTIYYKTYNLVTTKLQRQFYFYLLYMCNSCFVLK